MKEKTPIMQMFYRERGDCDKISHSDEYHRLFDIYLKLDEEFRKRIENDKELVTLYDKVQQAFSNLELESAENHYLEGFRFGALLICDVNAK